jgi:hypothetical protein
MRIETRRLQCFWNATENLPVAKGHGLPDYPPGAPRSGRLLPELLPDQPRAVECQIKMVEDISSQNPIRLVNDGKAPAESQSQEE